MQKTAAIIIPTPQHQLSVTASAIISLMCAKSPRDLFIEKDLRLIEQNEHRVLRQTEGKKEHAHSISIN